MGDLSMVQQLFLKWWYKLNNKFFKDLPQSFSLIPFLLNTAFFSHSKNCTIDIESINIS